MTIDELARRIGVTTRNIRYYQTRGLLPPPRVEGRTGYYSQRHVDRLQLIGELQTEGLNLQAIGWLLGGAADVDSDELRRLKRAVLDGWVTETPLEVDAAALVNGLGVTGLDSPEVRRAVELGLLEPTDDPATWRVLMPGVLSAGTELRDLGTSLERALDALATLRQSAELAAEEFVDLFDEVVMAPWDARGRPEDEWPEVREAVERLRPLTSEALMSVFRHVMAEAVTRRLRGEQPGGARAEAGRAGRDGEGSGGQPSSTGA